MSQFGWYPISEKNSICITAWYLKEIGIEIPDEWIEEEYFGSSVAKVVRLLEWPSRVKTKHYDAFYEKYFEKYPAGGK